VISLTELQIHQIKSEGVVAYPAECCGLLVGNGETSAVIDIVPSSNLLCSQGNNRFEIDPQTRINLERELRGTANIIIGHYHSHPDHPARPSQTDFEMAYEPNLIWFIVSILAGEAIDLKAHQLDITSQKFVEVRYATIN
jgi:proteasome lid subunit RPN8/RPN11